MKLDVLDERVTELLLAWGIPYCWGGGTPADGGRGWPPDPLPSNGRGFDCSGFAPPAPVPEVSAAGEESKSSAGNAQPVATRRGKIEAVS